jgi:rare lipoprotein A
MCIIKQIKMTLYQLKIYLTSFFLSLIFMGLSACTTISHHGEHDGPPRFKVNVARIPDAVPKVEPLCRYGNKPSYVIRGHRYYVLKSSENYDKRGLASWYGTLFHKHKTSCGEPYDMFKMTAASLVLPLPSYAEVTNLQNGKKVVVKVNDRGPFEKNRIMDLSWAAAEKIGVTARGTGYVEIKVINPRTWSKERWNEPTPTTPRLKHPGQPLLFLQVGALSNENKARDLQRRVAELFHKPVRIQIKPGVTPIYRIQIQGSGFGLPMTVIE